MHRCNKKTRGILSNRNIYSELKIKQDIIIREFFVVAFKTFFSSGTPYIYVCINED